MLRTATLALLMSLATALSAQITELRDYHGETIACTRSGLHGFAGFCGADTGFYAYVFTGTILSAVDTSPTEQRLQIAPDEIFYGKPPLIVTVFTHQRRCLPETHIGDKWLFYVRPSHQFDRWIVAYGDSNGLVADATEEIDLLRRLHEMHDSGLIRGAVHRFESDDHGDSNEYMVAGRKVTAKRASDNAGYTAIADEHGRYEFKPLPPGTYKLSANTAGSVWAEEGGVTIKPGSCYNVNFTLKAASTISGHVLFFHDQMIEPPLVKAVLESDHNVVPVSAVAGEDGSYDLKGLNPGRYLVATEIPDPADPDKTILVFYPGVTSAHRAIVIEVGKSETRANIDFEIPRP